MEMELTSTVEQRFLILNDHPNELGKNLQNSHGKTGFNRMRIINMGLTELMGMIIIFNDFMFETLLAP